MGSIYEQIDQKLADRIKMKNLRQLTIADEGVDFYSNDYLGLSKIKLTHIHSEKAGSSRLIAGNSELHGIVEAGIAKKYGSEGALMYTSGYVANLGLFSAIGFRNVVFLYDEACHASIKDGIRLSFAKGVSFRHNNLGDLERALNQYDSFEKIVIVESLYSMNGDFAPLKEINYLVQKFNAALVVDEAHSSGLFEDKGYCEYVGIKDSIFARILTFGKAFGSHGACVLGNHKLIQFLINFSRPFIYTTAIGQYQLNRIKATVLDTDIREYQHELQNNISYFRKKVNTKYLDSDAKSPIQMISINYFKDIFQTEELLKSNGLNVKVILSPTVPIGKECIRISIHAFNTFEQIDILTNILKNGWK